MKNKNIIISDYVKDDMANDPITFKNVREYAKWIGVSHTVIHDILNGKYNQPSPITATRMCNWFNLDPEELFNMIEGVDDEFVDKFFEIYNKESFSQKCRAAITYFYNSHVNAYLDENEEFVECPVDETNYTFANLKILDDSELSIYNSKAINATFEYHLFDVERVADGGDEYAVEYSDVIHISKINEYNCSLYYLPTRQIRKKVKKEKGMVYEDEEMRDFTNKFLHLLMSKDAPDNNIFLTPSKKFFDKIVSYTQGIDVTPTNPSAGIAIVYCSYRKGCEYEIIVNNGDLIQDELL